MIEETQSNLLRSSIKDEPDLAALAMALGAGSVLTTGSGSFVPKGPAPSPKTVALARNLIYAGRDPLGDIFCSLRDPVRRRESGATYTPEFIIASMLAWSKLNAAPAQVVDAGAGSGRFTLAAARTFPKATLIAVEMDPLAALILRANLATAGYGKRVMVAIGDYRSREVLNLTAKGQTLFIGNPPYVRHHLISPQWKAWFSETAKRYGYTASQLAGLHVHFFLRTLEMAKPGDLGVFVTAAEWLDVNYGQVLRDMFMEDLGGTSIHLIDSKVQAFADAATTAAVTTFSVGSKNPSVKMKRVDRIADLGVLAGGRVVKRERLASAHRWGSFFRPTKKAPEGYIELGEICSVHRGAVTGANRIWIAGEHSAELPTSVLFPTITRARELIKAGSVLEDDAYLRRVIDLPVDLDVFSGDERARVNKFLKIVKTMGGNKGFIVEHRRAWWAVGLRRPAPILATYMARRAPAFVRNAAEARHINIAHGIYPRELMSHAALNKLASHLSASATVSDGRTYAGGLTKFEPREMERLLVPDLRQLETAPS